MTLLNISIFMEAVSVLRTVLSLNVMTRNPKKPRDLQGTPRC